MQIGLKIGPIDTQDKERKMNYREIMSEAAQTANDRHGSYGDMQINMERTAQIATLITGIRLTAHDVALVLHALKLARIGSNRAYKDNYVDGVNYLAWAGDLASSSGYDDLPLTKAEEAMMTEVAEFAAKFNHEKAEENDQ